MKPTPAKSAGALALGIEAGGTRTVCLAVDAHDRCVARQEAGAANLRLLDDTQLHAHFATLAAQLPLPLAVGIGMAGAREESDRERIRTAAARCWPGVPCWVGNDLDTAYAAAGELPAGIGGRVVIISGTGSCCFGRNRAGDSVKVGGWGHLLGDRGSGYDLALTALQETLAVYDRTGRWPLLGARCLRALALNEPNDLVTWVHAASKADIAALAIEVFAASAAGDRLARARVRAAADLLARDAAQCAGRLVTRRQGVEFVLSGGTLLHQPRFAARVIRELRRLRPGARIRPLNREGAWGAVALARGIVSSDAAPSRSDARVGADSPSPRRAARQAAAHPGGSGLAMQPDKSREFSIPSATAPSPTEQRNPRSTHLDRMPLREAVELMLSEDARLPRALRAEQAGIERAVRLAVAAFRRGGRLIYVGAGTSGRLGVLDASECPPTFSVPPEQVQGIIAGGQNALWQSIEGAEDDAGAGARAVGFRGVTARDFVVGIAASGRTPFVWGALGAARFAGARTGLLCFNPNLRFARGTRPDVVLAPRIGPEVLTGSTRLKAGTATKLLLNLITTLAMVRLGKVVENLMVDVRPSNLKLRDRAVRIVQTLTGAKIEAAMEALEQNGWVVKLAIGRLQPRRRA